MAGSLSSELSLVPASERAVSSLGQETQALERGHSSASSSPARSVTCSMTHCVWGRISETGSQAMWAKFVGLRLLHKIKTIFSLLELPKVF